MKINKKLLSVWTEQFRFSPLVRDGMYQKAVAYQLYYGTDEEHWPEGYDSNLPENFQALPDKRSYLKETEMVERVLAFLSTVGITLNADYAQQYVKLNPGGLNWLLRQTDYILKVLAHSSAQDFNMSDPFKGCGSELYFFGMIESGSMQVSIFDQEQDLPDFYRRNFELPPDYLNDPVIGPLFDEIEQTPQSFLMIGKAGTGKSTFIHYFCQHTRKKFVVLSFTGIAATNVGGTTIHSFFRLPTRPLLHNDEAIEKFAPGSPRANMIRSTDVFIIDEVSMLRSDIFQAIERSLRINSDTPELPFGGKQIVLVGDLFQLPPVVRNDNEFDRHIFGSEYSSGYFFDAPAFQQLHPQRVELKTIYRQKGDLAFAELLNRIRTFTPGDTATLTQINARCIPGYVPGADDFAITLTSYIRTAEAENERRLAELPDEEFVFEAYIEGDYPEKDHPTQRYLKLKKHAQVIFVRNDSGAEGRRWVNGTIGKIVFISDEAIEVKLQSGEVHRIYKENWELVENRWNAAERRVKTRIRGTFQQYPVKLAWAVTIHKSQGLTFDRVILDTGGKAFASGQVYTALSRCRTLEGLFLKRPLRESDIMLDQRLVDFYKKHFLEK